MQFIKLFISIIIACILLDMAWIGFIAKSFYMQDLGNIIRKSNGMLAPNYFTAILVYVLITCGIIFFVLPKSGGDYGQALLWGSIFGLILYGVYDLTNFSILADYPARITVIDMVWGTILCSIASIVGVFVSSL